MASYVRLRHEFSGVMAVDIQSQPGPFNQSLWLTRVLSVPWPIERVDNFLTD